MKISIIILTIANFIFLIYNGWLLSKTQLCYNNINALTEMSTSLIMDNALKIKLTNEILTTLVSEQTEDTKHALQILDNISKIIQYDNAMFESYSRLLSEQSGVSEEEYQALLDNKYLLDPKDLTQNDESDGLTVQELIQQIENK